jgi:serine/threonine protein kinase
MNGDRPSHPETLPLEVQREVDALRARFEAAWQAGQRPCIEDYLDQAGEAARAPLLLELIHLEIACRRRNGEEPSGDEYRARFPAHETAPEGPPPEPPPPAFPQVPGYEILGELGRGGMGVVYEAMELALKRRVALKLVRFTMADNDEAMQRFRREAETVAALHHTNIVPIFAFGTEGGVHFYAMQLIAGRSLAAVLKEAQTQGRPLDVKAVAGWGVQAAEALAHAHAREVVHRDVKPSNLLLDGEGVVWLTDFGLARRGDETAITAAGAILGTPRYMSPRASAH